MKIYLEKSEIEKIEKLRESLGFSLVETIKYLIRKGLNVKPRNNPEPK